MSYLLLVVGFFFLIKGADWFVDGSSGVARRFGIPSVVIGLTIVAFGTSAPEAAVSITAALNGDNGIAVGNVLGSNIFNLLMVIGVTALLNPCKVDSGIIARDFPFSILISAVLLVLGIDTFWGRGEMNVISRGDGMILLFFMAIFVAYTIRGAMDPERKPEPRDAMEPKPQVTKCLGLIVIGIAGIVLGGQLVVESATAIAISFGISQTLIGLTIVAMGTSLPELVTSAVAAKKGESDIAIGNVVGSNIFNILFVLGLSSAITPVPYSMLSVYDTAVVIAVSLLIYLLCYTKRQVSRVEGAISVLAYFAYMAYIIVR
ncbi:MAG: calcium/sodium antiporter [Oscillospiraceae bacterium]|nr:calcium/sodium antiporter [Oscillospiraceae bacterium]